MNVMKPPPRSSGSAGRKWSLADLRTKGDGLPSRVVLHGVEKWGKTSWAAHAPAPIFLMARGETGLQTLIDAGRLGETSHLPELVSWQDTLSAVQFLEESDHDRKTIVLDTVNGFERLCHEFVCQRDFNGDWGERGFGGYQRGYEVALAPWRELLIGLDRLREKRRMSVIGLCHTKVGNFKNPEGPDYDRFMPDVHKQTWSLIHKWADIILFGNFESHVQKEGKADRAKGVGGSQRVIYTQHSAAYDAGNRHGLPPEIYAGNSGREAWAAFAQAMKQGREQVKE